MTNNEREHGSFTVSDLIRDVKEHLGLIIVAEAGHGKSYTAFTLTKEAIKAKKQRQTVLREQEENGLGETEGRVSRGMLSINSLYQKSDLDD